jgi:pyruvate dehydrogenase E2 component (dihydrolipoamide acetyltransferase)
MSGALRRVGGSGPDCLLLHGFGSDRLSWIGNVPALEPAVTVHVVDLPGHGDSRADVGSGSPAALTDWVEAAIETQGIRRLHLVGHSLGGGVALLLARRRPDLVHSLTLIAPAGLGAGIDTEFLAAYPTLDDVETATALLRRLVVRPHLIGRPIVQRALEQLARPGARDALTRIAAALIGSQAALEEAARTIADSTIPRTVIWGDSDRINPPSLSHLAHFGGQSHVIAGSGHLPHIESVKPVNKILAAFLIGNTAR